LLHGRRRDTDSVSFALRGEGKVGLRILERAPSELCISAITEAELRYGAERRKSTRLHKLIDKFTNSVRVAPFDSACAASFGKVVSKLMAKGKPIGDFDAMIAAHALALGLTLVTNNAKHFRQVEGLRIENWTA
jgi:tRNA(fMet)-specific endonuclease VapC